MPPPFTRKTDFVDTYAAADVNELQETAEDHETRIDALETAPAGAAITVQEEGADLATAAEVLNFVGTGVTATGTGTTKTISIPGAAGGSGNKLGYVVAAVDSPAAFKNLADYVCDGVADQVQWQAADDQAYADRNGATTTGVGGFFVCPGTYRFNAGFTWRGAYIDGASVNNSGIRVLWDGADGATAITRPDNAVGGKAFCRVSNINFRAGTNHPGIWMDLSDGTVDTVDTYCRINECQFYGGYTQLKFDKYVNIHWEHVRFDNWLDWGIHIVPVAGANLNTFRWSGGSFDSRGDAGTEGFLFIDNAANAGNLGTFHFEDMRWEVNTNWTGRQAPIVMKHAAAGSNGREVKFHFDNVTYQDVDNGDGLMGSDAMIWVEGSTVNDQVIITNSHQTGLSAIVGGSVPTTAAVIPVQGSYGIVAVNVQQNGYSVITDTLGLRARTAGTITNVVEMRQPGHSFDLLRITNTGDIVRNARSGTPAADPAVGLYVGSGVPAISAGNGSVFQRTDGSGTTDNFYVRRGGAWVGIA
jgi:hypothetical protein